MSAALSTHPRRPRRDRLGARADPRRHGDGDDAHLGSFQSGGDARLPRDEANRADDGRVSTSSRRCSARSLAATRSRRSSRTTFVATRGRRPGDRARRDWRQAFLLEAIATFFLVFVVFGTAVDLHGPKIGGLAIGLTVRRDILAIGPLHRRVDESSAIVRARGRERDLRGAAVYWIGPILGGIVAALLYDTLVPASRQGSAGPRSGGAEGMMTYESPASSDRSTALRREPALARRDVADLARAQALPRRSTPWRCSAWCSARRCSSLVGQALAVGTGSRADHGGFPRT